MSDRVCLIPHMIGNTKDRSKIVNRVMKYIDLLLHTVRLLIQSQIRLRITDWISVNELSLLLGSLWESSK